MDLREKALAAARAAKEKPVLVPVTFNGVDMFVRRLSGRERDAWEVSLVEIRGKKRVTKLDNVRARFAVLVLCDADGKPVFREQDAELLGDGGCQDLDRVYDIGQNLNGLGDDAKEDIEKN